MPTLPEEIISSRRLRGFERFGLGRLERRTAPPRPGSQSVSVAPTPSESHEHRVANAGVVAAAVTASPASPVAAPGVNAAYAAPAMKSAAPAMESASVATSASVAASAAVADSAAVVHGGVRDGRSENRASRQDQRKRTCDEHMSLHEGDSQR